ncbi:hypothetical protein NL676_030616 [Syzygium grande]|nr:hypothetical protein NL676_030616 [Syzygium grande]
MQPKAGRRRARPPRARRRAQPPARPTDSAFLPREAAGWTVALIARPPSLPLAFRYCASAPNAVTGAPALRAPPHIMFGDPPSSSASRASSPLVLAVRGLSHGGALGIQLATCSGESA